MYARILALAFAPALLAPAAAYADSWRCGEKLVGVGDLTIDVRSICGDPVFVERRTQVRSVRNKRGLEHSRVSQIEEWTYRQNERDLLRTLVFEDGRLISIRLGGREPTDPSRCERQLFKRGAVVAEVKLACGEPATQDLWVEHVEEEQADGTVIGRSITFERFVYNFGPDRFLRIFEFANGRLIKQRTGGYGYSQ